MPSALRIEVEGAEFAYAWIEARVVRVGSDFGNEICFDGIDSLAATMIYQDGRFQVINRTSRTLLLAGQPLPAGVEASWPSGSELVINDCVKMLLLCHADPRPQRATLGRWLPEPNRPERDREAHRAFRRQIMTFALTATGLFVAAALHAARPRAQLPDAWFARTLAVVQDEARRADFAAVEVSQLLQAAYGFEKRSRTDEARQLYVAARERLSRIDEPLTPSAAWTRHARSFVLARLERL
jgi:hypothetical protein